MRIGATCFIIWILCQCSTMNSPHAKEREKRYLIFPPPNSKVQLILGFGLPIEADYANLLMASLIKYNYKLPNNTNSFHDAYTVYMKRDVRPAITRWDVYSIMEQSMSRFGFDGKSCVLRSICDVSKTPLDKSSSILVELLHILLTPSSTEDEYITASSDYISAEYLGSLKDSNCQVLYPECETDLIGLITSTNLDV